MSYSDWVNNCIVVLSPQQLGLPNFSEGLSVRSSISIKLTLRPSPAARNLHENWHILNYTGTSGVVTKPTPAGNNDIALAVRNPFYEMRVYFDYENRSLLVNSRRELLLKKNSRAFKGNNGLRIDRRGAPQQRGLKLY